MDQAAPHNHSDLTDPAAQDGNGVDSVAFSANGEYLAAGDGDGAVYLWMVDNGNHRDFLDSHSTGVQSVAFSPDGGYIAAADDNGATYLWPVSDYYKTTASPRHVFGGPNGNDVPSIAYRSDGTVLAVGDAVGSTELWAMDWLSS